MSTRPSHVHYGFTLIETITAIVILSIAIPPMLWSIKQAHVQRVSPMLASKARWLATAKMEDIIADRHSDTRGFTWVATNRYPIENPIVAHPGFTRSVSITETGVDLVGAGDDFKRVSVTVGWTDATGTARSLMIETVLSDY